MRKLVLQMGLSLDGLVARPGRHGSVGWGLPPEDPALKERKLEWLRDTGLHLMGRNTYEEMAEFWPTSDDAYAAPMNDIPKVVFSGTLERAEWADSRIARGDLPDEIAKLKREPGKDMIAWGAPRSHNRSPGLGSSTSTALSCNRWHWARGFRCSRASRRRCGSSSSTRRHTTRARRFTSTAPRLRPPDHPRTMFKR
jgi:dihydrofolate reductase